MENRILNLLGRAYLKGEIPGASGLDDNHTVEFVEKIMAYCKKYNADLDELESIIEDYIFDNEFHGFQEGVKVGLSIACTIAC